MELAAVLTIIDVGDNKSDFIGDITSGVWSWCKPVMEVVVPLVFRCVAFWCKL